MNLLTVSSILFLGVTVSALVYEKCDNSEEITSYTVKGCDKYIHDRCVIKDGTVISTEFRFQIDESYDRGQIAVTAIRDDYHFVLYFGPICGGGRTRCPLTIHINAFGLTNSFFIPDDPFFQKPFTIVTDIILTKDKRLCVSFEAEVQN